MKITTDMIVGDILAMDGGLEPIFLERGMKCTKCPGARMESLERACALHGVDTEKLLGDLNAYLEKNA